jgi:CBS domain-containing protein
MSKRRVAAALSSRPLISVLPTDSVFHSAILMAEANCGSALVLCDGRITGIITERDILIKVVATAADPAKTSVDSVMTRKPVCVHQDTSVTRALYTMKELGFRHLPIIDSDRRPIGIFALRDALPEELAVVSDLRAIALRCSRQLKRETSAGGNWASVAEARQ